MPGFRSQAVLTSTSTLAAYTVTQSVTKPGSRTVLGHKQSVQHVHTFVKVDNVLTFMFVLCLALSSVLAQSLPDLKLDSLPELQAALQQQQQLLGLPADSSTSSSDPQRLADAFERLLSEGSAFDICPSAAAAQAVFRAMCFGPSSLARAAYTRLMAWCGEPEFVSGGLQCLAGLCG